MTLLLLLRSHGSAAPTPSTAPAIVTIEGSRSLVLLWSSTMPCATLPVWDIYEGQTSPTLGIIWPVDDDYLDGTAYTSWLVEAARQGSTVELWQTTAVASAVGTATVPSIVVTWAAADLGSLGRGDYVLELTGTAGTAVIKAQLALRVHAQVS